MLVKDVKPTMHGYALTIFRGVKIEAIPLKVVSIEKGGDAGLSLLWVDCYSERMGKYGPVSGMSGSPVFLWEDGKKGEPGKGGKLIGALAFGYNMMRAGNCIFGVQPIEHMLPVADKKSKAFTQEKLAVKRDPHFPQWLAANQKLIEKDPRLKSVLNLLDKKSPLLQVSKQSRQAKDRRQQLAVPIAIPNMQADALPMQIFKDRGFVPMKATSQHVPTWLKDKKVGYEPGGAIVIPIVDGDVNWSAIGTVTEVLKDGRVLGFGHAMFGQGAERMPMATGYVHFIHPGLTSSFKMGGMYKRQGAILNDENTAIAGKPDAEAKMVPVEVVIEDLDTKKSKSFQYKVIDHEAYLNGLASYMPFYSVETQKVMKPESSLRYEIALTFSDGSSVDLKDSYIGGNPNGAADRLYSILGAVHYNPYERVKVTSIKAKVSVEEGLKLFNITKAKLAKQVVKPGEKLPVYIELRSPKGKKLKKTLYFQIPADQKEGPLDLVLAGSRGQSMTVGNHQRFRDYHDDLESYVEAIKFWTSLEDRGLYLSVVPRDQYTAVNGQPMQAIPGSRVSLMGAGGMGTVSKYRKVIAQHEPMNEVVNGMVNFTVEVRKD